MNIGIIIGSHRKGAESQRVAKYIATMLHHQKVETELFDLYKMNLPLWNESRWDQKSLQSKQWKKYEKKLMRCDSFIIISPEWGGMVPAGLKNFFLHCGNYELAHKAGLIITVSAGIGGAYPVNELRTSSYKNTFICYVPEHIIIRSVGSMLHGVEAQSERDKELRERIQYTLKLFKEYTKLFNGFRKKGKVNFKKYPYGM